MPPKPDQIGVIPLPPMPPESAAKPAPVPEIDPAVLEVNEAAKFAHEFMKLGVPLQDGIPDDPQAELAKARKRSKGE
jgi:hypothetical protein